MNFFKKAAAACLAMSTAVAPLATQISTAVASRAAGVMAVGAVVALPGAAHAQSGKRICGSVWGLRAGARSGYAALAMEVYKWDVFTCTGLVGAWIGLTVLPSSIKGMAEGAFNNASGVGHGLTGSIRMMQTCENFSSSIKANRRDVCLSMTDYKLYKFVKVVNGVFSMGRV